VSVDASTRADTPRTTQRVQEKKAGSNPKTQKMGETRSTITAVEVGGVSAAPGRTRCAELQPLLPPPASLHNQGGTEVPSIFG
jgi:hypothetical protein